MSNTAVNDHAGEHSAAETLRPPIDGIFFSSVESNSTHHRLASTVSSLKTRKISGDKILIMLLHGWPESWYCWRHQLLCLSKEKSYLAVAPDMRGYGSTLANKTSANLPLKQFTHPELANDVIGIAQALGHKRFVLIGHDWGCSLSWSIALLYPERVLGVLGLSVPYAGTPKKGLLAMLQNRYGICLPSADGTRPAREVMRQAQFHYMLHHCLPGCAEEYSKNAKEFLYRIYSYRPGCAVDPATPEYSTSGPMFPNHQEHDREEEELDAKVAPGLWSRIPLATSLPEWLSEANLKYLENEYRRAGFQGGLCWYQAADLNFELLKSKLRNKAGGYDDKIVPRSLFIMGANDALVKFYGGQKNIVSRMHQFVPNLTEGPIFLPGCGHWIQQECPDIVNAYIMKFLQQLSDGEDTTPSSRL